VKHILRLFVVGFLFSFPAYAQSTLSNFSVTGSAIGFAGAPAGAQTASLAGVNYQVTSRFSAGYWNLNVPALATYNFGVAGYALPLSSILGKSISSKLTFDASAVEVGFDTGIGKVTQGTPVANSRVSEIVGGSITFPITANLSFNAVQLYWVHGGIAGTSGVVVTPSVSNFQSIGMGITISMDQKAADFKHRLVNKKKATVKLNHCAEC
jgi:hypothetical protein